MGGKQSGHNDISPTKLNSIHHKVVINTNRVERIDSTDYNTSCNCEMRWDEDRGGADVGHDVDDDLDDAVMMMMTMAMISPSERCSPRRNLPDGDVFYSL